MIKVLQNLNVDIKSNKFHGCCCYRMEIVCLLWQIWIESLISQTFLSGLGSIAFHAHNFTECLSFSSNEKINHPCNFFWYIFNCASSNFTLVPSFLSNRIGVNHRRIFIHLFFGKYYFIFIWPFTLDLLATWILQLKTLLLVFQNETKCPVCSLTFKTDKKNVLWLLVFQENAKR